MWYEKNKDFYKNEMKYIQKNQPNLNFRIKDEVVYLIGIFEFIAVFNEIEIKDSYEIEIKFPDNYPEKIPTVQEIAGGIPKNYHTNPDGNLCLGIETDLYLIFQQGRNLKCFFENILIHYFYRYSFIKKYNREPFGDYSHGTIGKIEFYKKYLKIEDIKIIKLILRNITVGKYSKNKKCPCGSNKKLRKCHGKTIKLLMKKVPIEIIENDYESI